MACTCGCRQTQLGLTCRSGAIRIRLTHFVRLPIVPVGELRGVIYRARRSPGDAPKNYVHFFNGRLPTLAANPAGTRLYIVGGQYRVTTQGIQG
jgi:hypothetical protein